MKIKKVFPQKYILSAGWNLIKTGLNSIPASVKFPDQGITATMPGTVHTDLLAAGLIEEPFFGDNEKKLVWIHDNDWIYELFFDFPSEFQTGKPVFLVCEGLDTICEIRLNGKLVAETKNMFLCYKIDINSFLAKKKNHLQIYFHSPTKIGQKEQAKSGKLWAAITTERVYLRKAQYSFGWDWGPTFPTMGIWQPIYLLQTENALIQKVRFHTSGVNDNAAAVLIEVDLEGKLTSTHTLSIELSHQDQVIQDQINDVNSNTIQHQIEIRNPSLWYPNGEGQANLYQLTICLVNNKNEIVDEWIGKVGIRTITLETISQGKSTFRFIINGKPVFIKGANWIPSDSFLARISSEKYERLLGKAQLAGMNMIRVWGGGIYENDLFYEICDRLGLMVWQDFMFACGQYPEKPEFLANVEEEFYQNINRLQHHPSLAIWCGNNENEWGWFMDHGAPVKNMPGYSIYHEMIPNILKRIDPLRPYWPTSPFGSDPDPNSEKSGNRHQWDIWSSGVDYSEVKSDKSLFVAEFGFQAPANRETIEKVLPESEWRPDSPLFLHHNKQIDGSKLLSHFLNGHLPVPNNWKDYIYLTQLNQGFALKTCIEHWRSRWPKTAGSIVWQLNDCWPVTSWSLIDFNLKPKLSYYFVKQAFCETLIHFKLKKSASELHVLNSSPHRFVGTLVVHIFNAKSNRFLRQKVAKLSIAPNISKKVYHLDHGNQDDAGNWLVIATLTDLEDRILHRNYCLSNRWKNVALPDSEVNLKLIRQQAPTKLVASSETLSLFVDLFHPDYTFSDRGFILLPGEEKIMHLSGDQSRKFKLDDVELYTLNKYLKNQIYYHNDLESQESDQTGK